MGRTSAGRKSGFTLIEMSLVLVILGLLVGGVLTGQWLIRAAELRSVTTQTGQLIIYIQAFRNKFNAIPGDMNNATRIWGADVPANCPGDATHYSTDQKTCDGNGNGQIDRDNAASNESYRFWQHLANAGLIDGSYMGTSDGSNSYSDTKRNSLSSKLASGLWHTDYRGTQSGWVDVFDGEYGNVLMFGNYIVNNIAYLPIFRPEELWNLDVKLDDGMPATGRVVLFGFGNVSDCTDTADNSNLTAKYKLVNSGAIACSMIVRQLF